MVSCNKCGVELTAPWCYPCNKIVVVDEATNFTKKDWNKMSKHAQLTEEQLQEKLGIKAPYQDNFGMWIVETKDQFFRYHYKPNADQFVKLWIAGRK